MNKFSKLALLCAGLLLVGQTLAGQVRSGDPAALRSAAERLLSTREGKALAEKLSGPKGGHG